jgi:hypothetical protein
MSRIAPVPAAASTSDRRRLEKASVGDWITTGFSFKNSGNKTLVSYPVLSPMLAHAVPTVSVDPMRERQLAPNAASLPTMNVLYRKYPSGERIGKVLRSVPGEGQR